MNFITKLSKLKNEITEIIYNSILIIINKFLKYAHFIVFKKTYNAEQLKYIILNKLIHYHEIFKKIMSDKNKLFIFNYGKILISMLEIKFKMSIIYHSKTNDQTEGTNQNFEQYFRHYVNKYQNNGIFLLFTTQLTMNSKTSNIIEISSFKAVFDQNSNLFEVELSNRQSQTASKRIKMLKNVHERIIKFQKQSVIYVNKKKKMAFQLKKKNKVYLLTKNLKMKGLNKKIESCKNQIIFNGQKDGISQLSIVVIIKCQNIFNIPRIVFRVSRFRNAIAENLLLQNSKKKGIRSRKNTKSSAKSK